MTGVGEARAARRRALAVYRQAMADLRDANAALEAAIEHEANEKDERLLEWVRMSEAGASASEIAEEYEVTRGQVIGALWRLRKEMDE